MRQTMPRHMRGRLGDRRPGARIGNPLPIGATVGETYRKVLGTYLGYLPVACLVPFLLAMLIGAAKIEFGLAASMFQPTETVSLAGLWNTLMLPIEAVPGVLFAVAWHRLILLGPKTAKPKVWSGWSSRHWLFFGYIVLFVFIVIVGSFVGGVLIGLVFRDVFALILLLLFLLCGAWWLARLSLVFPSAAIERHYALETSWDDTRQQGLRLMFGLVLVLLPVMVLNWVAIELLTGQGPDTAEAGLAGKDFALSLWEAAILNVPAFVGMALCVTFISLAFRNITGWEPKPKIPAGAQSQASNEPERTALPRK